MKTIATCKYSYEEYREKQEVLYLKGKLVDAEELRQGSYLSEPVQDNVIVYESEKGQDICEEPRALFEMWKDKKEYRHILVLARPKLLKYYTKKYKKYSNVEVVERESEEYCRYLATAKYLVNNRSFPVYFYKREEQRYLYTGSGLDFVKKYMADNRISVADKNELFSSCIQADYILSPNSSYTLNLYEEWMQLNPLWIGKVIENIAPVLDSKEKKDTDKKVVVWAPSVKIKASKTKKELLDGYAAQVRKWQAELGEAYQVYFKVPYYMNSMKLDEIQDIILPENHSADIYVTDEEEGFLVYLCQGRPVLFYGTNKELVISEEALPGPVAESEGQLLTYIHDFEKLSAEWEQRIADTLATYPVKRDGNCAEIWKIFIEEKESSNVRMLEGNGKKKIAFFTDLSEEAGWQQDFLYMLEWFDKTTYDVTVVTNKIKRVNQQMYNYIPEDVRLVERAGKFNYTKEEYIDLVYLRRNLAYADDIQDAVGQIPEKMFREDWERVFGKTEFDAVFYYNTFVVTHYMMFLRFPAKQHMVFCWKSPAAQLASCNDDEVEELAVKNEQKLYAMTDGRIAMTESICHEIQEKDNILCFSKPVSRHWFDKEKKEQSLTEIDYGGQPYFLLDTDTEGKNKLVVSVLANIFTDGPVYAHFVEQYGTEDMEGQEKKLEEFVKKYGTLYVFDGTGCKESIFRHWMKNDALQNKLFYVKKNMQIASYVRRFSGFVTMSGEKTSYNSMLGNLLEKPVILLSAGEEKVTGCPTKQEYAERFIKIWQECLSEKTL